ncbi:SMC-Scp complex subunit ScpB [Fulvivirga maritima]|uniref:SMC-Scp complex subunit ScpB n=1 Tax=Fulvivirga maritima TaxID=2904247 RepID=UPI001F0CD1A7|nr:SMC-Scp complex subunit ScpB [Fulvivirga maritima]UII28183.1 SMC-Scp complex subunit ScpB [Fulvivirga maritima]
MDFLQNHIEALIFCSPAPILEKELQSCLSEMFEADVPIEDIENVLGKLKDKYEQDEFSFSLDHTGGGYQFLTKPAYQASIGILLKQQSKRRLSTSALETLSIIAYKQPVTKGDMESIRGVNCDYAVQKLLEKGLIEIKGKSDAIGRPLLYGTSDSFMEYFGINSLNELPTPKDFTEIDDNVIGEESDNN